MKNLMKVILIIATSLLFMAGCDEPREKFERKLSLGEHMSKGGQFAAEIHNGRIKLVGGNADRCDLNIKIIARGRTVEEAQLLAESVETSLVSDGAIMKFDWSVPDKKLRKYVSVSIDGMVPEHTSANVITHNGGVDISYLIGNIKAVTHNGKVSVKEVTGDLDLMTHNGKVLSEATVGNLKCQTHNGKIGCNNASVGSLYLETHNGGINANCILKGSDAANIEAVTHNGSIAFGCPKDFSGSVEMSTHNGKVKTDVPIVVQGKLSKKSILGRIGQREGKLRLATHNGSIHLKELN